MSNSLFEMTLTVVCRLIELQFTTFSALFDISEAVLRSLRKTGNTESGTQVR